MDLKSVPLILINNWISTLLSASDRDVTNLAILMQMTDAEKVTSFTAYLQSRIANN